MLRLLLSREAHRLTTCRQGSFHASAERDPNCVQKHATGAMHGRRKCRADCSTAACCMSPLPMVRLLISPTCRRRIVRHVVRTNIMARRRGLSSRIVAMKEHVVIVGAGPVGLVSACLLVDEGISRHHRRKPARTCRATCAPRPSTRRLSTSRAFWRDAIDDRAGPHLPDLAIPGSYRRDCREHSNSIA